MCAVKHAAISGDMRKHAILSIIFSCVCVEPTYLTINVMPRLGAYLTGSNRTKSI